MKFDLCIGDVFQGINTIDAIKFAAKSNIPAVEHHCWWEEPLGPVIQVAKDYNVDIVAIATYFISITDKSQHKEYFKGLKRSIDIAKKLNCKMIITQVGDFLPGVSREQQHQNIVDILAKCVQILHDANMILAVEPVNDQIEQPGYYLTTSREAFKIEEEVASKHVKILFDIYHQQVTEGDLLRNILPNLERICHFHTANQPGRHELELGEINYPYIFKQLQNNNYTGYIGLEYSPTCGIEATLETLQKYNAVY